MKIISLGVTIDNNDGRSVDSRHRPFSHIQTMNMATMHPKVVKNVVEDVSGKKTNDHSWLTERGDAKDDNNSVSKEMNGLWKMLFAWFLKRRRGSYLILSPG